MTTLTALTTAMRLADQDRQSTCPTLTDVEFDDIAIALAAQTALGPADPATLVVELLNHVAAYGSALECDHGFNGEEWAERAAAAVGWKGPRP